MKTLDGHRGIAIVAGSKEPCACGAKQGALKIPVPENETIEGTHKATFPCPCGKEIPCKISIDMHRYESN